MPIPQQLSEHSSKRLARQHLEGQTLEIWMLVNYGNPRLPTGQRHAMSYREAQTHLNAKRSKVRRFHLSTIQREVSKAKAILEPHLLAAMQAAVTIKGDYPEQSAPSFKISIAQGSNIHEATDTTQRDALTHLPRHLWTHEKSRMKLSNA